MITDEERQAWRAEQAELAATLKVAKNAANHAIANGAPVPEWAATRIKCAIEEEGWWEDSIREGFSINEYEIPNIVDGIDTGYFDQCLPPGREEELLAGAEPTDEERIIHRSAFFSDLFGNPQNWENELTFWHVFEVRGRGRNCYLLVGSTSGGQGGPNIDVFEFFANPEAALDWLRADAVLDMDFLRWRVPKSEAKSRSH